IKGGVKVDAVDGAAARAGLREGDVIVSIANVEVTGVKGFEAALAKIDKTKNITVLVRRGELAQFVIIKPAR
ncbi:MAG: PDZ domain-containing protein, partial [Burkholderiales bacterium]|nr:PDZ domain-containing protein [Burkholderiales bacterium]